MAEEEGRLTMSGVIFASAVRAKGDLAGVFEYDGDTAYFYLYDQSSQGDERVVGAIHVLSGLPDFHDGNVAVRWNVDEEIVGLFIFQILWAAFDGKQKYGGNYRSCGHPDLPDSIAATFTTEHIAGE